MSDPFCCEHGTDQYWACGDCSQIEIARLTTKLTEVEAALTVTTTMLSQLASNGPECDCPPEGHLCGWPKLQHAITVGQAALTDRRHAAGMEKIR